MSSRIRSGLAFVLIPCALATGCGGAMSPPEPPNGMTEGPHHWPAIPLANGKAYVEVALERPNGKAPKAAAKPRIVAYFLDAKAAAALSPPPSQVSAKVNLPGGKSAELTLYLDAAKDDPAGASRFVSQPGDLDYDEIHGELTANLDGGTVTATFALR